MPKQKWRLSDTALIAEIIAAIGIIVSVLYLAVQVSGSNISLRAQTHSDVLTQFNQALLLSVDNPELASTIERGLADPDRLSEGEWRQFRDYHWVILSSWEYAYYLNVQGAINPELWNGGHAYFSDLASNEPSVKRVWEEVGIAFAEPFKSYADQFFEMPISEDQQEE